MRSYSLLFRLSLLIYLTIVVGCATSTNAGETHKTLETLEDVKGLKMQFSKQSGQTDNNSIRMAGLQDVARSLGAQTALAYRAREINAALERNARKLDNVYNFYSLMLPNSVMPPVLTMGDRSFEQHSDSVLRVSDKTYEIMEQAKFVTSPGTWRDHLWMEFKTPNAPDNTMLPTNAAERAAWATAVDEGWEKGIRQADNIFSANLAKITQRFKGMVLYRSLLAQNMVTAPYVAKTEMGVSGNGHRMDINDRVLRITAMPELNTESRSWQAAITAKFKKLAKVSRPKYSK